MSMLPGHSCLWFWSWMSMVGGHSCLWETSVSMLCGKLLFVFKSLRYISLRVFLSSSLKHSIKSSFSKVLISLDTVRNE